MATVVSGVPETLTTEAVWLVTCIATVILDVGLGLLVGTALAFYFILRHPQSSITCTLGQLPGTTVYKNTKTCKKVKELLGIKIFRFESSIFFANAEHFRDKLYDKTGVNPRKLKRKKRTALHRVLMQRRRELQEMEATAEQKKKNTDEKKIKEKISIEVEMDERTVEEKESQEEEFLIKENREIRVRFSKAWNPPIHTMIVDFSVVGYIDNVGINILSQIVNDFKDVGVKVFIAECRPEVRNMLKKADFYTTIDYNCIYYTIHEAAIIAQEIHLSDKRPAISEATLDLTSDPEMDTLSTDAGNGSSSDYTPHDSPTYSGVSSQESSSSDSGTVSHNGESGDIELQTNITINGSPKASFRKQMQTIYEPEDGDHLSETSELLQNVDAESNATGQISASTLTNNTDYTMERQNNCNISAGSSQVFDNVLR